MRKALPSPRRVNTNATDAGDLAGDCQIKMSDRIVRFVLDKRPSVMVKSLVVV